MADLDLFEDDPTAVPVNQQDTSSLDLFADEQPAPIQPQAVATPVRPPMEELYQKFRTGQMSPGAGAAFQELAVRRMGTPQEVMGISTTSPYTQEQPEGMLTDRQQAMKELAGEVGPLQSFLIGAGEGFTTVGRGLGITGPAGEIELEAMSALEEENPISAGLGEAVGEAAPFLPLAVATGGIAPIAGRALATGAVGAVEGGVLSKGRGGDVTTGAGMGGGIGLGAEILFPVIGKLGRKVFQRVTGKAPTGAMLDAAGQPTQELKTALDSAGMTFDDLTKDATEVITGQKPGASVEQVATKARAAESGIPLTRGEVTKDYPQLAKEQRLIESAEDTAAEPLRQFKLKQSEAIKKSLRSNLGMEVDREGAGQLIQDSLTGRKKLLRTQKNELYQQATEAAKDIGGVPIFTDNISDVIPDAGALEDLAITAPQAMESLDKILTKYGMKEPTRQMVEAGFEPTPLTIENFERFRKTLGAIERGDQTGAAGVAIGPIRNALDDELADVDGILSNMDPGGFNKWFKGSDVVDSKGEPLTVFHGTSSEFDKFDPSKTNDSGLWFTSDKGAIERGEVGASGKGIIKEVNLSAKNLAGWDEYEKYGFDELIGKGYDGVKLDDDFIVFEGSQVRPAMNESDISAKSSAIKTVRESLTSARKTVRQLKTEFSPQSIIGKIIDTKKDGVTQMTEASKVYSKLVGKASPVEETRRTIKSLLRAGDKGKQAVSAMQSSTILDLIDAGFGTESRKISGVKVFNPIAFKRRLDAIGPDKMKALFSNEKTTLAKLRNIDKIASDLIPPSGAQPKGSASVILDLMNNLGLTTIASKVPVAGPLVVGALKKVSQPIKTGLDVKKALAADVDVENIRSLIDKQFPGIASALGIVAVTGTKENKNE